MHILLKNSSDGQNEVTAKLPSFKHRNQAVLIYPARQTKVQRCRPLPGPTKFPRSRDYSSADARMRMHISLLLTPSWKWYSRGRRLAPRWFRTPVGNEGWPRARRMFTFPMAHCDLMKCKAIAMRCSLRAVLLSCLVHREEDVNLWEV